MALEKYGLGATITADSSVYVDDMGKARDATGRFVKMANTVPGAMSKMQSSTTRAAMTMKEGLSKISGGIKSVGEGIRNFAIGALPLTAGLIAGIKQAGEFEAQMSTVGSVTRANEKDMASLTKEAKRMGIVSVFTATQAGEGM